MSFILKNPLGLTFRFLESGLPASIDIDSTRIGLKELGLFSKFGANLYLRKRKASVEYKALLGPDSNSKFEITKDAFIAIGTWDGLEYRCILLLSDTHLSWKWSVEISNESDIEVALDLIYVQDAGMKKIADAPINEYYVSQYLDRRILEDERYGSVICCRQNSRDNIGNPWLMIACENSAIAGCTDGIQFYGKSFKETGIPEALLSEKLGGECSGELSILALEEKAFLLAPKDKHTSTFVAIYLKDHPEATSEKDSEQLASLFSAFKNSDTIKIPSDLQRSEQNLFTRSKLLSVENLTRKELDDYFDSEKRFCEEEKGELLSFFYGANNHVVLRAKELLVDRPHGHIMQASAGLTPDENIVSSAAYSYGVFNSHLTQGNTNFNCLLSICSSQFNLERETGQRIIIEIDNEHFLLGIPSAFEMGLNHCRWIYKFGDHCIQVRTWTSKRTPKVNMDFKVLSGPKVKLFITNNFDEVNAWSFSSGSKKGEYIIKANSNSLIASKFPKAQFKVQINSLDSDYIVYGDEVLYADNKSKGKAFLTIVAQESADFSMSFIGEVVQSTSTTIIDDRDKQFSLDAEDAQNAFEDLCLNLSLKSELESVRAIQEIIPWYSMNALTHLLTPYGLEQFSGAAWGTRDTMQGPFELLLSTQKYDDARKILCIMFSNQNIDGGWPQWFMFDRYFTIRCDSSHADIYHWCLLALSNYIKVCGDVSILNEVLPYYNENGLEAAEKTALSEHAERLINMIVDSFIPGTSLVPFGGGDWNDSMQPVSSELSKNLISSWTVALNYQAFNAYQIVYKQLGEMAKSRKLIEICSNIKADFNHYLIKDGVVGGHGLMEKDGSISLLLHPSDKRTNIHYRLLPMMRGIISGIFSPNQVTDHLNIIEKHLKGPDGARLMNRPPKYNGGIQSIFQRAESSTYFGREIGIMYMHAHLRYAEALSIAGKADEFAKTLRQANPVAYRAIVSCGDFRQANCYYSSSDVSFKNRYEADDRYEELIEGKILLKGGWRIYSSGPGIYINLIISNFLGLRTEFGNTILDPVIPKSMNGLEASINYMGHLITLKYIVEDRCYSPKEININGTIVNFLLGENQYRLGGAVFPIDQFIEKLNRKENRIEIRL